MENIKIVEMICDIIDSDTRFGKNTKKQSRRRLITYVQDRPGHDRRYAIDSCKLREKLNWTPEESLVSGIKKTIHWYYVNYDWVKSCL